MISKSNNAGQREFFPFLLEVLGLSTLAVTQPVLDLLSHSPEFFVAHRAQPSDLIIFVAALLFMIPSALALVFLGVRPLKRSRATTLVAGLAIGVLAGAMFLLWCRNWAWLPGKYAVLMSAMAGLAVAFIRNYSNRFRQFLAFLSVSLVIVPLVFFSRPQIWRLMSPETSRDFALAQIQDGPPIVWITWDEFPVFPLMNENGDLDEVRFPNYARLAAQSTWYRKAISVSDETIYSLPAMLTGKYPVFRALAQSSDYPANLFAMLENAYSLSVFETQTRLYPEKENISARDDCAKNMLLDASAVYLRRLLPEDMGTRLPAVTGKLKDFWETNPGGVDRVAAFERFLGSMTPGEGRPACYFFHDLLPHGPYEYLPTGVRYDSRYNAPPEPRTDRAAADRPAFEEHCARYEQRLLLQIGYSDFLIGKLLDRMQELKILDKAIIIVTADHGISFDPDTPRRIMTRENASEILRVPLFVKLPGQSAGVISDQSVTTLDILPTVLDVMKVAAPEAQDGASLLGKPSRTGKRRVMKSLFQSVPQWWTLDDADVAGEHVLARKLKLFGTGDWTFVYRFNRESSFTGKPLSEFQQKGLSRVQLEVVGVDQFENVRTESGRIPCLVHGKLSKDSDHTAQLGIFVNGRLGGVVRPSDVWLGASRSRVFQFETMIPPDYFRQGRNDLEIFEMTAGGILRINTVSGLSAKSR